MVKIKQASAAAKFRLLMWKNFLQQWRHRIQTLIEILLPVATMSLVLVLRSQIQPESRDVSLYQPVPAHTLVNSLRILPLMNFRNLAIAYSPKSPVLKEVLTSSMVNMLSSNINDILEWLPDTNITNVDEDILKMLISVHEYDSSSDLSDLYMHEETTLEVIAAIQFNDSLYEAEELSDDVSYFIRFPERTRHSQLIPNIPTRSWRTDTIFPPFPMPGPRSSSNDGGGDPGYVREMFIAIQHAVSSELISRLTNIDMKTFSVNIQRYPHPPFYEDMAIALLQIMFPMFLMLSFATTAINIVKAVTIEKELQLKETMKIMGLPTWLHWTAWFFKQFIYLLIIAVLVVILIKVNWFSTETGFTDYAVLTYTPWTVIFFFLMLYLTSTIFFSFMISGFFSKAETASLFTGVIWFLSYIPAFLLSMEVNMSAAVQILTCLSFNSAMSYGFQILLSKESTGGLQWGEFMSTASAESDRFLFGHVVIMLAVDCVLYMLIALYLEQVLPGTHGVPRPWYFPFQPSFWCPSLNRKQDNSIADCRDDEVIQENDPTDLSIGVKISKLTKVFGKNTAVDNLSLNIYNDQITVLLGHNGAGKSTTISMLTGNIEPSSGSMTVAGYDVGLETEAARGHLGICPQHNVLFNELTVREHIEFFARLKGFTGKELKEEIDMLIAKLELEDKRDYQAAGLSGGQKRRLSVGVALCGRASVILLDEPTSGMDPSSRRALWDLLQKEKKGRSMILTTHFMDEADILGDRVAIMAGGRMQCVGSSYFLKQHYGVGYSLVIVKNENFDVHKCLKVIDKYIPGIIVKEDRGTEVTFSLNNEYSHIFEDMLKDLEDNWMSIGFKDFGLVATTLEDVFMSVGSDVAALSTESEDYAASSDTASNDFVSTESIDNLLSKATLVQGSRMWIQHIYSVWYKLWLVWTRSWVLLSLQVLGPLIQIIATLFVLQYVISFVEVVHPREFTLAEGYISTETLLEFNEATTGTVGFAAANAYKNIFNESDPNVMALSVVDTPIEDYYLERGNNSAAMAVMRNSMLIGATFTDNAVTAWFSNFGYHDIATSLATVYSALLHTIKPDAIMNVFNYPLQATYRDQMNMQLMVSMLSIQLSNGVGSSLGMVSAVFVMFYVRERVLRAKLLQKASGVKPIVLWGSSAVFDWLWFMIISITVIVSCAAFQVIGFSTFVELGRMYVAFMFYGAAMLPVNYIFSHAFSKPSTGFVIMFFINILLGMMGSQIVEALFTEGLDTRHVAEILDQILQFFPLYSLVTAVRKLNVIGLTIWSCNEMCDSFNMDCSMDFLCSNNFTSFCCMNENPYFEWSDHGIGRYLVCMVASGILFWAIFLLIEYRVLQKCFRSRKIAPSLDLSTMDTDVVDEMNHVNHIADSSLGRHNLVAKSLTKYYRNHLAVNQVSFSVGHSECFGLLGVNGAGKTTTFKMLMGDETVSTGDAFVSGYSIKNNLREVHENIGYCPQFDALFNEMTGRESLRFYALLRGLRPDTTNALTIHLAASLGFTKHLDKRVHQYSGGNKRKLSTAIAMMGFTRLVFLDEPTTGVDPAAKRQVWRAIRRATHSGRGVVLTSHSMEECEALCSRLTIMVQGRFVCLGTPQHLKNKFSQGFTLTIKLAKTSSPEDNLQQIESIKNYINTNFVEPKLMEEYKGFMTYYLQHGHMPWSRMFGIMEKAKKDMGVEDYNISQTTLEQIFLQFTKYQ